MTVVDYSTRGNNENNTHPILSQLCSSRSVCNDVNVSKCNAYVYSNDCICWMDVRSYRVNYEGANLMLTIYFLIAGLYYVLLVWYLLHTEKGFSRYRQYAISFYRSGLKSLREKDVHYTANERETLRKIVHGALFVLVVGFALLWPIHLYKWFYKA